MRKCLLIVPGLLALTALAGRAQVAAPGGAEPPPQRPPFRAGVEVVDVDVSVLDKYRLPVTGLTAADFSVLEDGHPRPIVAFTPVDLPLRDHPTAPWMAEVASDLQTNDLQREGRLVVVLLDRSIAFTEIEAARRVAVAAVEQLRPADLAAIAYTEYGLPQNFTSDRRRLLNAIRQPSANLPAGDAGDPSPCFCGVCTLDRITNIANAVRNVRQRRKLLFIIGSNVPVTSRGPCSAAVGDAHSKALRAIGAANLTVYVFDPSGVATLMGTASMRTMPRRGGLANLQRLGNLKILPDETGGRAVTGNDPERTLPEIFRESNSYYVLGFNPAHSDGHFHDIRVKVGRRDVILQARRGYVADGGALRATSGTPKGVERNLYTALAGLWPKVDLPLTLAATPLAAPGLRSAAVVLTIGVGPGEHGRPDPSSRPDASASRRLNVLVGAFDRNGQGLAFEHGTTTAWPHAASDGAAAYDVVSHLELRPGRYEIRAAVEDAGTGESGSVYTYVDVPDFLREFVSLSGLFLHTSPPEPTARLNDLLPPPLPDAPAARRNFARSDHVAAWLQIYQGLRRPAMPGYLLTEIRDERDTRVFQQETRLLAEDVGTNRAISEQIDLPLSTLAPGAYLLSVQVRQGNVNVQRELRFNVQ